MVLNNVVVCTERHFRSPIFGLLVWEVDRDVLNEGDTKRPVNLIAKRKTSVLERYITARANKIYFNRRN
jgi:hypothetical protein